MVLCSLQSFPIVNRPAYSDTVIVNAKLIIFDVANNNHVLEMNNLQCSCLDNAISLQ